MESFHVCLEFELPHALADGEKLPASVRTAIAMLLVELTTQGIEATLQLGPNVVTYPIITTRRKS